MLIEERFGGAGTILITEDALAVIDDDTPNLRCECGNCLPYSPFEESKLRYLERVNLSPKSRRDLTTLRDYMRGVPADRVHLGRVYWHLDGLPVLFLDVKDCGAVGCLFGWATTIPSFKRRGLNFHVDDDYTVEGARFFGLGGHAASLLFSTGPSGEAGKRAALARLDALLSTKRSGQSAARTGLTARTGLKRSRRSAASEGRVARSRRSAASSHRAAGDPL